MKQGDYWVERTKNALKNTGQEGRSGRACAEKTVFSNAATSGRKIFRPYNRATTRVAPTTSWHDDKYGRGMPRPYGCFTLPTSYFKLLMSRLSVGADR